MSGYGAITRKLFEGWNGARAAAGLPDLETAPAADMAPVTETPPAETPAVTAPPAETPAVTPPAATVPRPESVKKEDYDFLLGQGYSPENIARVYAPYDPSSENYLQRMYELSMKKPENGGQQSRKREQAAFLGDSIRLLGEMYASGKGAHVNARQPGEFLFEREQQRQRNLEERYQAMMRDWQRGLFDAVRTDYGAGLDAWERNRSAVRGTLRERREAEFRKQEAERHQGNTNRNYELEEKRLQNAERHQRVAEQQAWSQLAETKRYHDAHLSETRSGGGRDGGKTGTRIVYPAVAGDPEAVLDPQTGRAVRVRDFPLGIDHVVREALADQAFLKAYPEWQVYADRGRAAGSPGVLASDGKPAQPTVPTAEMKKLIVEEYALMDDRQRLARQSAPKAAPQVAPGASLWYGPQPVFSPTPPGPYRYTAEDIEKWKQTPAAAAYNGTAP
jgi:hypothetical protein